MVVPNPKDIVTQGLGNITALLSDMQDTALDIMAGYWTNGSVDDPAQVYSPPVFMLMQAVDDMAQAKELGQEEQQQEEEEERERKENVILLIISVVFMVSHLNPSLYDVMSRLCHRTRFSHLLPIKTVCSCRRRRGSARSGLGIAG